MVSLIIFLFSTIKERLTIELLQSLIVISNQYNVSRLCQICEKQLSLHITHQNVVEILQFAEVTKHSLFIENNVKSLQTVPTLSKYAMYVIHNEIAILSLTGGLLDLPPDLRKEAVKYKNPYSFQGIKKHRV